MDWKPWFLLPPVSAHRLAISALSAFGHMPSFFVNSEREKQKHLWKSLQWRNLFFRNPFGIAAGVDKNAEALLGWERLGAGFIEVGTVTRRPQGPNPGQILDRDTKNKWIWNKMGFPNDGANTIQKRVENFYSHRNVPVFINVGKNRTTPIESAASEMLDCIKVFQNCADAFVLNISSPNTSGLRDLFQQKKLELFLNEILKSDFFLNSSSIPVLLKLSPDLEEVEFKRVLETSFRMGISGFILTNTTLQRPTPNPFSVDGGLSGAFLKSHSVQCLKWAHDIFGKNNLPGQLSEKRPLLISVGGLTHHTEALERLKLGADLVQTYSGLIFEGPQIFKNAKRLAQSSEFHHIL